MAHEVVPMNGSGVTVERIGHIALVVLNRPERKNALNEHMWNCMENVIDELKKNLPRVVVITGAGNEAFCAGFDVNPDNPQVSNLVGAVERHEKGPVDVLITRVRSLTDELVFLPVPVIAAINGLAYGGGAEIATRCDLRVMDENAVISFSEVRLGLMPDHGGVVGLTRLIGPARAADLILTARKIDAREALSLGLVNRISAPGKSVDEAVKLAEEIAANGPLAVRHALTVIRRTPDLMYREALKLETQEAVDLITSGECVYGIAAFLTKKKPEFPDPE